MVEICFVSLKVCVTVMGVASWLCVTATAMLCPHSPKGPLLHGRTLLLVSHVSEPETTEKLQACVHHMVFVLMKVYDAAI